MAYQKAASVELLQAALIGYELELATVTERIAEIRRELAGGGARSDEGERKPRSGMSAAGRARVAAAQRKRWAALKKSEKSEATPSKAKRKMSAAGRKRIIEATQKRWAAWRAAKAAAE
jgi:hypothetical protein